MAILFETFPDLKEKISWIPLLTSPTPVEQLRGLDYQNLWIKRDDGTSNVYGGNKVRKLEFILGDVKRKGKSHVLTMGGLGTNHGLATTIFCKRERLSCSLLLFDQPITEAVKRHLLLFKKYGAQLIYSKSFLKTIIQFYMVQRLKNSDAYFLYFGGSTPVGALGFVNAVFELKRQVEEGLIPEPTHIFCPLGSNGTLAGMALGVQLSGLNSVVTGVRVTESHLGPLKMATSETAESLMRKTYNFLRTASPAIPKIQIKVPKVLHEYFGDGYGFATEKGVKALELMKENENVMLDQTYTSKTFAAVIDFMKNTAGKNDSVLYWHTYNSVDLSEEAEQVDYHDLPKDFHHFFEQ